ncbi:MAG TPA: Hsp70 family protein [Thermoanaerobaculia bacterium]|nr:Hsp70 family protein [Thermoanaerobaculia bacterium]
MGTAAGIDLGTTNSVIARLGRDGKPVVIPNAEGEAITPSVICFKGSEILVGATAKELQAFGIWPVAAFFKRQMGDPQFIFHVAGVDYSATDLSAMVLRKLKADAEAAIGERIDHAVITVPAYFRDPERKATMAAGAAAGLEVIQVINEPTAAAVAYSMGRGEAVRRMLVYDLGGGTFDVTLLELTKDGIVVSSSEGDHQLGGKDWDDRIIEFLAGRFHDEFGVDPLEKAESLADLLIQAEDAKKKLTAFESTTVSIAHEGNRGRYPLSRAKFEELTTDLMERTVSLTNRVLEDKGLAARDIEGVLLVGGSTRMPMVHRYVEQTFGRPPMGGVNVDEAVALGAAIVAAEQTARRAAGPATFALRGAKTIDVTNHSLGMIAVNEDRSAYVNSIILPKNKVIPCAEMRPYQHRTRRNGDNTIEVFMTQGETESPGEVAYIGRYVIHDIPHRTGVTVIEVTYRYDASGTVSVTAQSKGDPAALRIVGEALPPDVPQRFLGRPEPLQVEVPEHVTAYLAFDLSGSMSGAPLAEAKKAAHGFLQNTDLTHASIGVIAFSDNVRTKLKASQNARAIERAIDELRVGETGGGNEGHPFDEIHGLYRGRSGRRFAIVLADGVWSRQDRAIQRAKVCHAAGIDVIAIGFGSADRKFLRAIASSDESSFFTSMSGLVETFTTIAQVLTEKGSESPAPHSASAGARTGFFSSLRDALGS